LLSFIKMLLFFLLEVVIIAENIFKFKTTNILVIIRTCKKKCGHRKNPRETLRSFQPTNFNSTSDMIGQVSIERAMNKYKLQIVDAVVARFKKKSFSSVLLPNGYFQRINKESKLTIFSMRVPAYLCNVA
jgi:hypothetical protein